MATKSPRKKKESKATLIPVRVRLDSLIPDPANARQHNEQNIQTVVNSLRTFGQVEPLIAQKSTRRLIAGHGRIEAMQLIHWEEADVVFLDVSDDEATRLALVLNRSAELATWNIEMLPRLLSSIKAAGGDVGALGWSEEDAKLLIGGEVQIGTADASSEFASGSQFNATTLMSFVIECTQQKADDETVKADLAAFCAKHGLSFKVRPA